MNRLLLILVFCLLSNFRLLSQIPKNTLDTSFNNYIDSLRHLYPLINLHFAGVPGLTSRYNVEVNIYNGLFIEASYGNRFFDRIALASTTDERFYGLGTNYKVGLNKKRTSFISANLNEYLSFNFNPFIFPKKNLYSMASIGYFHVGKEIPISYFIKTGPLIRTTLNDNYSLRYTNILGLIAFDLGIGYSFYKTYRK